MLDHVVHQARKVCFRFFLKPGEGGGIGLRRKGKKKSGGKEGGGQN